MTVKPLTPEDTAEFQRLKLEVQEAVKASQVPFQAFKTFADATIRKYFEIPEDQPMDVAEFEIADGSKFIVRMDKEGQ